MNLAKSTFISAFSLFGYYVSHTVCKHVLMTARFFLLPQDLHVCVPLWAWPSGGCWPASAAGI